MYRRIVFAVFSPSGARSFQTFDWKNALASSALSHSVMATTMGGSEVLCSSMAADYAALIRPTGYGLPPRLTSLSFPELTLEIPDCLLPVAHHAPVLMRETVDFPAATGAA